MVAALTLGALLGFSACSDMSMPTEALETSSATVFASASVAEQVPGQYLVLFKGNGIPPDFSESIAAKGGEVVFSHDETGFAYVRGLSGAAAAELSSRKDISAIQADGLHRLKVVRKARKEPVALAGPASPANPGSALGFGNQWNMRSVGAPAAWAAGKLGSQSITVAILDSGIDYELPDLAGRVDLTRSISFIPEQDTLAKYFPALTGLHEVADLNGHGTNVATQVSSNALYFAGLTSQTTLMGVKVLSADGSGPFGAILSGVLYAVDNGADVINMSLGTAFMKAGSIGFHSIINGVFNYAKQKGVLVVVAAGNEGSDMDHDRNIFNVLCDAPHVVCVSAVGPAAPTGSVDVPSFYTNYGRSNISVAAPGGNAGFDEEGAPTFVSWIDALCARTALATDEDGNILGPLGCDTGLFALGMVGTSQASPHVAGLAASLMAEYGRGNASAVKQAIIKSADDLGQRGTDPFYGRGRINVARAFGL